MNNFSNKIKLTFAGCALLTTIVSFSACLKKQDNIEPTPIAVAYLINAAPHADYSKFYINNRLSDTTTVRYTNKSATFGLTEGTFELSLGKRNDTTKFIRKNFSFTAEKFYTIFAVPTETSVEFIQKEEFTTVPTTGKVKIRFANFLYGSPKVNFHLKNVGNAFTDIDFKTITPFIELSPGDMNFQVKSSTDTTQIKLDQTLAFEANKAYTVITGGYWNHTTPGILAPAMWKVLY